MERLRQISRKLSWLTLIIGVVVGGYILMPQIDKSKEISMDQTEQQDQGEEVISEQSNDALNVGAQVSVERNSYLIEEILGIDQREDVSADIDAFIPSPSKTFRIVFEHIISPNSP